MGSYNYKRLKPYLSFRSGDFRNAYKVGRSTIDVLPLPNKQLKTKVPTT